MTFRLTLGIDPGQTGAIAALADGVPAGFIDMPTHPRPKGGGSIVDAARLAAQLRGLVMKHPGAYVQAVIERVQAIGGNGKGRVRGSQASGQKLGQADGIVRGVIGALGIDLVEVEPQTWKRHHGLLGTEKDAARRLAITCFPALAFQLELKKNGGRADALLVATWAHYTEQIGADVQRTDRAPRRSAAGAG